MSAELVFIGRARTPYPTVDTCPRHPWTLPAVSVLELDEPYAAAADGLAPGARAHVLWWADRAQRDVTRRRLVPGGDPTGVFVSRGVDRPNPLGLTLVDLVAVRGLLIEVRGMDCVSGSPLLDIKLALPVPEPCCQ